MKQIYLTTLISILAIIVNAQDDWEMPMKNGIIYFQDTSKIFDNKKHNLCVYLSEDNVTLETLSKLRGIVHKRSNVFSNTNYYFSFAYDLPSSREKCISGTGSIRIGLIKEKTVQWKWSTSNDQKMPIDEINALIKFEFIGNNRYVLTIKGFTAKGSKVISKGYVYNNETLEEVYNAFVQSEKKSRDQINFLKDIKGLISLFNETLSEQLERAIAVEEL